ncbi:MAG: response regulator [Myxococcales bacterium]|nr:response regulator [Myxococcales bacterium]
MRRLLLVEDELNERFTLSRLLEAAGYEVVALPDASKAMGVLGEGDWYALITDVMMPGTDGLTLAREVARVMPGFPIVLTSAFHLCAAQLDRLNISPLHFIDKPMELPRLLEVLEHPAACGRPRAAPSLPLPCLEER